MPKATRHTDAYMTRLSCPKGRRNKTWPDAFGHGLQVYVGLTGVKLWKYRFNYAGRKNDVLTLGVFPVVRYEEAKEMVLWFERVRTVEKRDPRLARYSPMVATTLDMVVEAYLPTLAYETRRTVTSNLKALRAKFGANPIRDLTAGVFQPWLDEEYGAGMGRQPRPGAARAVIRYLSAAINLALNEPDRFDFAEGYVNPTKGAVKNSAVVQEHRPGTHATVWEDSETKAIHDALRAAESDPSFPTLAVLCIELGMITGARPQELATLEWTHVRQVPGQADLRWLVKDQHKTWKRTKRPRRITTGHRGVKVLERARAFAQKEGIISRYVFPRLRPSRTGKEYITTYGYWCDRISEQYLEFRITPVQFRSAHINHTLAASDGKVTAAEWEALLARVAENVGHKDVLITLEHYRKSVASDSYRVARLADAAYDRYDAENAA